MNYAIAFLGLIFFFAAVYWVISGRNFYTGPLVQAVVANDSSQESTSDLGEKCGRKEIVDHGTVAK